MRLDFEQGLDLTVQPFLFICPKDQEKGLNDT